MINSDRLFTDVAGLAEETQDTVIPNGETWEVFRFTGSAAYLDDTVVCVVWDPAGANQIVDCTHGDKDSSLEFTAVGDGVKVLRISLQNDTNTARVMGCSWEARKVS